MLLYEHPLSSYAQKVKIALREKGVAFDVELPADFGTGRTDGPFVAANPRAEVPALIDGDFSIFESTIIMDTSRSAGRSRPCFRATRPPVPAPA